MEVLETSEVPETTDGLQTLVASEAPEYLDTSETSENLEILATLELPVIPKNPGIPKILEIPEKKKVCKLTFTNKNLGVQQILRFYFYI